MLDNGANKDLKDSTGRTAYDYAKEAKQLIKTDKSKNSESPLKFIDKNKIIDETKMTKCEYSKNSNSNF